jgi:hypothetical protein
MGIYVSTGHLYGLDDTPYWILADNQSAVDIIKNSAIVNNIRLAAMPITVISI